MANFIVGLISLSVSVIVLANVLIYSVKNTDMDTNSSLGAGKYWSAAEVTMWGLISLISIVGMVYGVMQVFGLG